ncbi:MAG TPA: OmpA family protein [Puia sp.]|uniref:OmpA/MotB family protein n=1 Tax=Puia sp. TaxID=2045100 RepID=UPI002CCC74C5|nr:OmpA family protein [Puia sp.]HVU98408.1 OmpA family protein [Puia sp.]
MRRVSTYLVVLFAAPTLFGSCVTTGTYRAMEAQAKNNDSLYNQTMRTLKTTQDANATLTRQKTEIQTQMTNLNGLLTATQENNALLRKQLTELSALSSSQAESIKRSLENIGSKDIYIQQLRAAISHRDSANFAILVELKAAIGGFGEDVAIKLDKGVVSVELSEKLLFDSDSNRYTIDDKAKAVIGRLARVLNDQPDVEITVLAHTESVVHPQEVLVDDWDLSVKRATSVVRMLQTDYSVSPLRMTAAGRSEYAGMAPADTPEGRAANRRTRIIIQPQLEPLIRLLERKSDADTATGN